MDTPRPSRRGARVEPPAWFAQPIEAAEVSAQTTVGVFLLQAERLQRRPMVHDLSCGAWGGSSWYDMKERATSIACALVAARRHTWRQRHSAVRGPGQASGQPACGPDGRRGHRAS
jgi:hypothetical protein